MINIVKEERIKKQLTQTELADLVNVSRQTIFSIEINKYTPSVLLAMKLAKVLGRKVEQLFIVEESD
ncbi:helix-turn-helix transcriptional regulator [Sediminibacterium sp.]|uniref:helix-turn-helix transcriptional regulator n=1 Tax=Sediminibacterium sp. TaxID=1917865 RepID=UPI002731ACAE|nr:helix-turn-helix transcriptional regulator [Sediminibacterium sp.]MDP2420319.1 helix-turn-helix transcriptional regulator [Sediminibacterium sp.]